MGGRLQSGRGSSSTGQGHLYWGQMQEALFSIALFASGANVAGEPMEETE